MADQSDFDIAVSLVLKNEGGYANIANDSGGPTNYGISSKFLREISPDLKAEWDIPNEIDEKFMKALPLDLAKRIYLYMWKEDGLYRLDCSSRITSYVFDMCVSMGKTTAIKILQRCVCVADDGIIGPVTADAVHRYDAFWLMESLRSARMAHYRTIIKNNPKDEVFIDGWLRRCNRFRA